MDEYLQYMRTLRLDVEDHAAKVSVEEQMQVTTIKTLEKDLDQQSTFPSQIPQRCELHPNCVETKSVTSSSPMKTATQEDKAMSMLELFGKITKEVFFPGGKESNKSNKSLSMPDIEEV
ncbi:hypothetical protein AALP_AA7G051600 [Arabis alpina]|uniref:Uncharacterized protein n=1 Tax=Arabis alpina TaxID=50452 RepID=A0A087GG06_ARAAL|nr:hypothetical protein AALP_AA7G051600 [Arabis alpina]